MDFFDSSGCAANYATLTSGKGCFFYSDRRGSRSVFRKHVVEGHRVHVGREVGNSVVFVENRSFSAVKRRGMGAAVLVKEMSDTTFQLGVCICCTLWELAYIRVEGGIDLVDSIYGASRLDEDSWVELMGCLEVRVVDTRSRWLAGRKRRIEGHGAEAYFVNLAKSPRHMLSAIPGPGIIDSIDGCYSYLPTGPDMIITNESMGMYRRFIDQGRKILERTGGSLISPPMQQKLDNNLSRVDESGRGNILLIAQKAADVHMKLGVKMGDGSWEATSDYLDIPFLCDKPTGKRMAKISRKSYGDLSLHLDEVPTTIPLLAYLV